MFPQYTYKYQPTRNSDSEYRVVRSNDNGDDFVCVSCLLSIRGFYVSACASCGGHGHADMECMGDARCNECFQGGEL